MGDCSTKTSNENPTVELFMTILVNIANVSCIYSKYIVNRLTIYCKSIADLQRIDYKSIAHRCQPRCKSSVSLM